jgi:hypothetical protein
LPVTTSGQRGPPATTSTLAAAPTALEQHALHAAARALPVGVAIGVEPDATPARLVELDEAAQRAVGARALDDERRADERRVAQEERLDGGLEEELPLPRVARARDQERLARHGELLEVRPRVGGGEREDGERDEQGARGGAHEHASRGPRAR